MTLKLKSLKDQVIVITGASSGIGLVTARMAARKGVKGLVLSARNEEALKILTQEINGQGGHSIYVTADVGNEADVNKIAKAAIKQYGGFDTWVNNAGVTIFGDSDKVSIEDMRRMFDTNFWGAVYGSRIAVQHFKERGISGSIINTGSFFGDRATPVQSTYAASKHALHGFTDSLRMELEKENVPVSVTLLHPGRIDTPYNEHAQNYYDKMTSHGGYVYPPEAVAEAILYSAAHPKRDMFIGLQSKIFAVLGSFAPRLMDKIMEAMIYPTQVMDKPAQQDPGLYHPGHGLDERGSNVGMKRARSYYVKAEKHPILTSVAIAGIGAAATYLIASRLMRPSVSRKDKGAVRERTVAVSTPPQHIGIENEGRVPISNPPQFKTGDFDKKTSGNKPAM